jgi:hypothetical protein
MSVRALLFDRTGAPTAQVQGLFPRSWVLNGIGTCVMRLPLTYFQSPERPTAPLSQQHIRPGAYLLVEHDKLPDWGGIIRWPQKTNTQLGIVDITCYTAEYLLKMRASAGGDIFPYRRNPAGVIFKELIEEANEKEDMRIRPGTFNNSGPIFSPPGWHGRTLFDQLVALSTGVNGHWGFVPSQSPDDGHIIFTGHWWGTAGVVREQRRLMEGVNIQQRSGALYTEQDEVVNRVYVFGGKKTLQGKRHFGFAESLESIGEYGLVEARIEDDSFEDAELNRLASEYIEDRPRPRRLFQLDLVDVNDTFSWVRLGDTFPLVLNRAAWTGRQLGFEGYVQVMSMTYEDTENVLNLTVQEVLR